MFAGCKSRNQLVVGFGRFRRHLEGDPRASFYACVLQDDRVRRLHWTLMYIKEQFWGLVQVASWNIDLSFRSFYIVVGWLSSSPPWTFFLND